jgi:hypothetical protein
MFGETFSGSDDCRCMEAPRLAAKTFDGTRDRDCGDYLAIGATDWGRD